MARRLDPIDVLRYSGPDGGRRRGQGAVRRAYAVWRKEQGIPERCDEEACAFHSSPLVWNGHPLRLVLDHRNGVRTDNRIRNLRLLCPNCDSLQPTRGGANRGRVEMSSGGFAIRREDGLRDYFLPAETGRYRLTGSPVEVTPGPADAPGTPAGSSPTPPPVGSAPQRRKTRR